MRGRNVSKTVILMRDDWPTFQDLADTHGVSMSTLRKRFRARKDDPGIEVWRADHRDPYLINPDHVQVLLDSNRPSLWRDPLIIAEEFMFMCASFGSEERAVKRLSDAYDCDPRTITRALKRAEL